MAVRNQQGLTEAEFLARYDASRFERPSVSVDMVICTVTNEVPDDDHRKLPDKVLRVLLVKRGDHPCLGSWALPGGFVNMDEDLDTAAARELQEETGITGIYMEQLYTWGEVGRDPRTRVISCSYLSLVDAESLQIRAGDDAADARWFTVRETPLQAIRTMTEHGYVLEERSRLTFRAGAVEVGGVIRVVRTVTGKVTRVERQIEESAGLAFDHLKIIDYGLERLRTKAEWSDIAFNLMPDRFTMAELRKVYETILGRELHAANFRRDVGRMVEETNDFRQEGGHRHAKLFRFNPRWSER
ncbi:MAG TPA: NUDIX domain-containing protein [Symbiobacteriaceae bacterium]|nr:NUDIX domain-containing protein [Symbiobacteriaceae bacterium]